MANAGFRLLEGQRTNINGLDAFVGTYQGTMQGLGNVGTRAAHIVHGGNVYLLAGIVPANGFRSAEQEFARTIQSFRPLSASEAERIRPNRVDLYVVDSGDSWEEIAQRTGGVIKPSTLAIMNNFDPNTPPPAGDRIKVVVEG